MRRMVIGCGPVQPGGGCPPRAAGSAPLTSLAAICDAYVEFRRTCCDDRECYEQQPTLTHAITNAGMAMAASGKRSSHHTRKPSSLLKEATRRLLEMQPAIARVRDFDALMECVENGVGDLKGLGALYTYDT